MRAERRRRAYIFVIARRRRLRTGLISSTAESPTSRLGALARTAWDIGGGEFQVEKGDDVFRVLLYGGSFVWGTGALSDEETISGHLEKLLNQRVGGSKRFEVINCGESGYLSTQEAVFLLVEGVYLSPDLVVFLDGANDSAKAYQKLPAGYPFLFDRMNEVFSEGLRRRHREAFTIDNELEYFKRQRAVVWSPGSIVLLKRLGVLRQKASEQKPDAGEKFTTAEEYAIRHFRNVRCVRGLGEEFGFATAFAIQPMLIFFKPMHEDERQILEALKKYETYSNTHAWWEKYYRRYTDMVLAMCRDADISVLDLRRVFAGNSQPLYIDDVHLTGDGYYLIAEALCRWLTAEGLVAPARRSSGQSGVTTGR